MAGASNSRDSHLSGRSPSEVVGVRIAIFLKRKGISTPNAGVRNCVDGRLGPFVGGLVESFKLEAFVSHNENELVLTRKTCEESA